MKKRLAGIVWLAALAFVISGCGDYGRERLAVAGSKAQTAG